MQLDLGVIGDDNTESNADSAFSDSDIPRDDENIKKNLNYLWTFIFWLPWLCVFNKLLIWFFRISHFPNLAPPYATTEFKPRGLNLEYFFTS